MRTDKDAKAMAKSLRESLTARNVFLSHSECLEIVAKVAGFADWNTLSAKLAAESGELVRAVDRRDSHAAILGGARQAPQAAAPEQASCSFCGKSTVRSLIEGECSRDRGAPQNCVFICDECVVLCAQINTDFIGNAPSSESLDLP
jgi:Glyoxalase superfamily protein/ClpX C4-type zinc finger